MTSATLSGRSDRAAVKQALSSLKSDVGVVRDDARELANAVGNNLRNNFTAATADARKYMNASIHGLSEQIRSRPAASVAIAAGAGLAIGLLFALTRR